jgi:hypothetical protein
MKLVPLACLCLAAAIQARVLLEVEFDIAPNKEETEEGKNAVSQILASYLQDTNLVWMRYLNTLIDGTPSKTPSRVAYIEFESVKSWSEFETNQKGPTHVLLDIYWLPWRRLPWISVADPKPTPTANKEGKSGGYIYSLKYTLKTETASEFRVLKEKELSKHIEQLNKSPVFLDRRAYQDRQFQSELNNLVVYEFLTLDGLTSTLFSGADIFELTDSAQKYFTQFAATVYQPPYEKGGDIISGESYRTALAQEQQQADQQKGAVEKQATPEPKS